MNIQTSVDIARSPGEVFAFMVDQANWAAMDPALVDLSPRGRAAKGQHGTITRRVMGMRVTTAWVITELEPGSRMTMLIAGREYELGETSTLTPEGSGTRVTVVDTLTPTSLLGRLMVPLSRGFIRRDLEARTGRLKSLLDG
jgi:hypothetical protein